MKNVVALILCKGNSKGVKNKNMKMFSGKPLMYWTIKSLKESRIRNKIYISSESKKILNYAKKQKITCIKRPKSMSKPKSQSEEAILHALKIMKSNFDYIVFPQVTSPIRPKNIFDKSLKFYFKQGFDSLFSANIPPKIFFWKKKIKKKLHHNITLIKDQ